MAHPRLAIALALLAAWGWPSLIEAAPKTVAAMDQEQGIIAQLDRIDQRLAELKLRRRQLAAELAVLSQNQDRDERRLKTLDDQLKVTQKRLQARLKALYILECQGFGRLIFGAPNLTEALFGWQGLARMIRFDLDLIKDYNGLKLEVSEAQRARLSRRAKIEDLNQRLIKAESELVRHRRARAGLLLKLEGDEAAYEQALKELDRAAARLESELAALEEAAPRGPSQGRLAESKGRLPWPALGRLTRMVDQRRPGVLIEAPPDSPVKAVGDGRVAFAGWIKGYGRVVIIDHGARYYSLSAHLAETSVKVGDEVKAGQVIGRLGRAGLSVWGVYFEIRRRDRALDPTRWLAGASN